MNAEQKERAIQLITTWRTRSITTRPDESAVYGDCMTDILQELVDAPEPEPVARVTGYYAGYLSIATVDGRVLPAGTALYLAPPAPSVPDELSGRFTDPAKLAADLPAWENGDDPLVGWGLISRGVVDFATVGIWPTKPTPSGPDGWRSAIAKEFPLYDEDEIDEDKHCCEWVMLQERKRLHKILAAPTPAEAPADVALWIDTNDKTQKQFLPHVGERVLFCYGGKTYYGKHTGGSFISFTNPGKTYPTWECHWMYPPAAIEQEQSE